MASIGKVAVAAVSASQETTLALANLNFDFSLVKLAAPPEYESLGACLSKKRKTEAEDGRLHRVARKLGALFADDLPNTPHLFQAYGQRVSEIAGNLKVNPKGSQSDGAFQSFVGADGTSIWAAATSGKGALAVHLLGCMLARIWSGPEAVSIWSELVTERKAILMGRIQEEQFQLSTITASQIEISRNQLAEWDASARSWLLTGDEAKTLQQKQLLLIIDNMGYPMKTSAKIYGSVMHTWTEAMTIMDRLISGMPQRIQTGEILLGLSSWHLFPDISVLGEKVTEVRQKDSLVRSGGIITLGIQCADPEKDGGVQWSMPLSHLRYYGKPVESTRVVNSKSSRVSFEQLVQVAIGSLTTFWGRYFDNAIAASSFITKLCECLETDLSGTKKKNEKYKLSIKNSLRSSTIPANETPAPDIEGRSTTDGQTPSGSGTYHLPWLMLLREHAELLISSNPEERKELCRLYALGRRRCVAFLAQDRLHPPPLFGLTDPQTFLNLIRSDESKITFLRNIASSFTDSPNEMIIRYLPLDLSKESRRKPNFEYATLLPQSLSGKNATHRRWIVSEDRFLPDVQAAKRSVQLMALVNEPCEVLTPDVLGPLNIPNMEASYGGSRWISGGQSDFPRNAGLQNAQQWNTTSVTDWGQSAHETGPEHFAWKGSEIAPVDSPAWNMRLNFVWNSTILPFSRHHLKAALPNDFKGEFSVDQRKRNWNQGTTHPFEGLTCHYQYIFGDPSSIAIFKRNDFGQRISAIGEPPALKVKSVLNEIPIEYVLQYLDDHKLDGALLSTELSRLHETIARFSGLSGKECEEFGGSIHALEVASTLYAPMSNATIDLGVTSRPLAHTKWASAVTKEELSRASAFSSIAFFETGFIDLDPSQFDEVMALSSGNSLFVSDSLLRDPWDNRPNFTVRRVIGNVGRPGLSLLLSPREPNVREPELGAWSVINHQDFDGKLEGNFAGTSLHLSLTGYEAPASPGHHGLRGQEASYVEAVVSAYDSGKWIADLNVLRVFHQAVKGLRPSASSKKSASNGSMTLWKIPIDCTHSGPEREHAANFDLNAPLTSIDNWDEFLDPPTNNGVIRATGNWLARIAVTAIAVQKGFIVIIAPETADAKDSGSVCWRCASSILKAVEAVEPFSKIFVLC